MRDVDDSSEAFEVSLPPIWMEVVLARTNTQKYLQDSGAGSARNKKVPRSRLHRLSLLVELFPKDGSSSGPSSEAKEEDVP